MTPQQIVGAAVRLFAIWLVMVAIQAAGTSAQPGTQSTIAPYVFSALFLVVAIFLWLFPLVVAHRLVPRTKFDNELHVPRLRSLGCGLRHFGSLGFGCPRSPRNRLLRNSCHLLV